MHTYTETCVLPYAPEQLFALVVAIEHYPEFIPWCRGARIINREKDSFLGELVISFSHLTERYTSRITPAPATAHAAARIDVAAIDGPFEYLNNHWKFMPHPEGCEIQLDLNFQFKSKLLDKMLGGIFERACAKMVGAFTARAHALYDQKA